MSKTNDKVLLVPGESGWEIWTSQNSAEFVLHSATVTERAADLTEIPTGDITLLFPVKSITAVPMRVTSDDEALFPDLAALHAERLGLRPDPMAGQLTDIFIVSREPENTALLSVLLRAPGEGEIPARGPKGFDISPRAYPLAGESIAIWKEFGRWVFAIFHHGNLVYCQATSVGSGSPDDSLAREVRLALMQLSMQGLEIPPTRIIVWSSVADVSPVALRTAFRTQVDVTPRPAPVLPSPISKLLPADVRAARRAALKKQNILAVIAAVVLIYLGLLGWAGYGLWKNSSETKLLLDQAQAAAPEGEAYAQHIAKWDELSHAIELSHSPVDILKRIADCIPPNSGLRLRTADISALDIKIQGEAGTLEAVNRFSLNLTKNNDLTDFTWQTPEPNQSTRGWEFVFSADVPTEGQP